MRLTILFALISGLLFADMRSFVWTYEYSTMEAGEAEFEHYLTFQSPAGNTLGGNVTTKQDLEIEIGMNDRFDVGIYQSFKQEPGGSLTYSGFKLRGRYKLGEKDKWFVDPLLYFEYKGQPDFQKHELEWKLVLAKTRGKLTMAINPVWETKIQNHRTSGEWKYNGGISYRLFSLVGFGIEFRGSANGHYWGPVIAHGGEGLYVALGTGFAYTAIKGNKPEVMMRMILGVEL